MKYFCLLQCKQGCVNKGQGFYGKTLSIALKFVMCGEFKDSFFCFGLYAHCTFKPQCDIHLVVISHQIFFIEPLVVVNKRNFSLLIAFAKKCDKKFNLIKEKKKFNKQISNLISPQPSQDLRRMSLKSPS